MKNSRKAADASGRMITMNPVTHVSLRSDLQTEILDAAADPMNWSAGDDRVLIRARSGWFVLVQKISPDDGALFDVVARRGRESVSFWTGPQRLLALGKALRSVADRKWKWPGAEAAERMVTVGTAGPRTLRYAD